MLLADVINNGEQKELLTNSNSNIPSVIHLNLDTCQNSLELKHSSYCHLFQSITNMSHHHLMACAFCITKRSLISLPSKMRTQESKGMLQLPHIGWIRSRK